MKLVILTGASGSGKTTIANTVGRALSDRVRVEHFDSIGVPSLAEMVEGWGSGEGWQRAKTSEWLSGFSNEPVGSVPILFEGQIRPRFLSDGLRVAGFREALPILVDCDDRRRKSRLEVDRSQPELASDDMMRWAALMRLEAAELGWEVLDTSTKSLDESVRYVCRSLIGDC